MTNMQKDSATVVVLALAAAGFVEAMRLWLVTLPLSDDTKTFLPMVTLAVAVLVAGVAGKIVIRQTQAMLLISMMTVALFVGLHFLTVMVGLALSSPSFREFAADFNPGEAVASLGALGLAGLGGFACWNDRSRSMRRSRQSAFGDTKWMSMEEAQSVFPATGDVVVGEAYRVDQESVGQVPLNPKDKTSWGKGGKAQILGFDLDFDSTHMMFFAGSGGFKTTSTVVPTALRFSGSMVVLDPAAEIGPLVTGSRVKRGRKVAVLSPTNAPATGFNVFGVFTGTTKLEEDCAALARLFISEDKGGGGGGSNEFFASQATNLLAALVYYVVTSSKFESIEDDGFQNRRNLAAVRELISLPTDELSALLRSVVADSETPAFVKQNCGQFVGMAKDTFSGIMSTVAKDTAWLSLPAYSAMVCGDSFEVTELPDGNLDVFLQIPGDTLKTYPGIGRVILGSLMSVMVKADGCHKRRVLYMLDEVDLLGYMSVLTEARDRGRKFGMSLMLMYQSIGQLEGHFGKDGATSWLESCSFVSFAAIKSMDTADVISARCGQITIEVESTSSARGSLLEKGSRSVTVSKNAQQRELILAHEVVMNMRADEQIVFVRGRPPLRCGRALYFRRPEMLAEVGTNRFAGGSAQEKSK
ncbi:MAG: type IV secretory system conjugative DNA transfer family protein [Hyphomicrobiaceae bacterium]